ncbi:MAG: RagB/SusD family nutrient uptake outer membrane protein, partial [Cytophagales bacterium]
MKKIAIILSVIVSVSSCNVLDQVSPNDVAGSDVFKTKAGAEAALVGMYNSLQQRYYYGGMFQNVVDLNSDIGTGGGYQNTVLDEIGNVNISTSNTIVSNIYLAMYYTIATANAIIAQVDGVNDPTFTKAEKDNMKGQALAVRALAHFDLLRTFGEHWDATSEYGIPVVLTPQKATDVVSRSTVANSYAAIIKDINDALALIDQGNRSQAYFNILAIKALLARVHLYNGNLASASVTASEVIDDGKFA